MFIKIGSKLINTNHIRSIDNPMADDVKREIEIVTDESAWHILEHSPDYPEALKAYQSLCEGAIRFDDTDSKRYIVQMIDIYQEQPAYAVVDTETDTIIPNPSGLKSIAIAAADKLNSAILPAIGHDPETCPICAALEKRNGSETNNTVIVLNPAEEKLLRLIGEKAQDDRHGENDEHAVDGLIGYRFIMRSNYDGHLYITKTGIEWLDEHAETSSVATDNGTGAYRVEARDGFHEAINPSGAVIDGSTDKMYIQGLVDNLNTEMATFRKERDAALHEQDLMQDRIDDLDHMVDEARRERDTARTNHQKTINEFAQTKRDLREVGNSYQEIQKTLDAVRENWRNAEEGLRNQNHELEMRNAQLATLLRRVKQELANNETLPELHKAIEATLNEPDDDLPF